jgi:two-component system, response regulator YesN
MESNEIDLLFTDLAMPVMSGIELMRSVRERYPSVSIVVLTMHQDFEYIQDALRLGAVDYIAKVQMEMESFEEVLARVQKRMVDAKGKSEGEGSSEILEIDEGYAFVSAMETDVMICIIKEKGELDFQPELIDEGIWLWLPTREINCKNILNRISIDDENNNSDCGIIILNGLIGKNKNEIQKLLIKYKEKRFFYDYHPNNKRIHLSIQELERNPSLIDEEKIKKLKEQWLSLAWVQQTSDFEKLLKEMKALHLPKTRLVNLLYLLVNEWIRIYNHVISKLELPVGMNSWYDVENWFYSIRDILNESMGNNLFSSDVQKSIMKAVRFIHEDLACPVHASDIAKRVNMSRSYFSQCFKDLVGMTFNEYVRHVRVEKAKDYLVHTNKTITWIAENTGYADDKYFSRIFRKKTGSLPSEYRKMNQKG